MALYTKATLVEISKSLSEPLTKSATMLREEAERVPLTASFDIFLSHSYLDAPLIRALSHDIRRMGFSVYVDWIADKDLSRDSVTRATAERLRQRMDRSAALMFATSANSSSSVWMPWELGYFDGSKGRAAVLPVLESGTTNTFRGREYLGLYPYVVKDPTREGDMTLWIHEDATTYVAFTDWLAGKTPFPR